MRLLRSVFVTVALALATRIVSGALAADAAWTVQDVAAAADAATSYIAEIKNEATQASQLVKLAEALSKAGATGRARELLVKAKSMLGPPHDLMLTFLYKDIIRDLVGIGDDTAAEALVNEGPLKTNTSLLEALATARAEVHDIEGAFKAATMIASLSPSIDPPFGEDPGKALNRISISLIRAGAIDQVLLISDGMKDRSAALPILAIAATSLCNGARTDQARDLAERAATGALAVAKTTDKPFQILDAIFAAAEAVTACSGTASAATFVSSAIASQLPQVTRSAVADRLVASGQLDLALVLAPTPEPDNAKGFFERAKLLKRCGDLVAAENAALEASRIIIDRKASPQGQMRLGNVIDLLADLGAYDAAIAAAEAGPLAGLVYVNSLPLDRNAYYVRIVGAAIEHKDQAHVARLIPIALKALGEPTANSQPAVPLLEDLVQRLAAGGYREEARPVFERLLSLSQDAAASPASRVPPQRMAALKAVMGDLSGALKSAGDAGPMTVAPSGLQVLALTTMESANRSAMPSPEEFAAAMERARTALPLQLTGPKAKALSAVARELATLGDIAGALQITALLDVEPRDILASERDATLSWIARAQIKNGDLRGALATTLKMTQGYSRWDCLVILAGKRPNS